MDLWFCDVSAIGSEFWPYLKKSHLCSGAISYLKVADIAKILENLSKIFGFAENVFSVEDCTNLEFEEELKIQDEQNSIEDHISIKNEALDVFDNVVDYDDNDTFENETSNLPQNIKTDQAESNIQIVTNSNEIDNEKSERNNDPVPLKNKGLSDRGKCSPYVLRFLARQS